MGGSVFILPFMSHKYIGNPFESNLDVFATFVTIG